MKSPLGEMFFAVTIPAGKMIFLGTIFALLVFRTSTLHIGVEYYQFSTCGLNMSLKPENRYREVRAETPVHCGLMCGSDAACKSFDYHADRKQCHLGSVVVGNNCGHMVAQTGGTQHYAEGPECVDGKELRADKTCQCPHAFDGPGCAVRMEDCSDWDNFTEDSGVQWIWPQTSPIPFQVYCDKMKISPRTMLMKRHRGDVSFHRSWMEYSMGFGLLTDDHWLGLDFMHLLTLNRPYNLRFSIKLGNRTEDEASYVTHNNVFIDNYSSGYTLSSMDTKSSNNTVHDCLYPDLFNIPFSTYDVDNDLDDDKNCSMLYGGGWWFNGTDGCAHCNPTGRLLLPRDGMRSGADDEVYWANDFGDVVPTKILMFLLPR